MYLQLREEGEEILKTPIILAWLTERILTDLGNRNVMSLLYFKL